jgi:dTDP-L-rhamnose 4-epimerase
MKVLVSGGAGFIGSHLVDKLVERGYEVKVLDNLEEQVHRGKTPNYLNKDAEYIWGDIRDEELLKKVIKDVEVIFHFASAVGVGQSQYEVKKFIDINATGTASIWDAIINSKNKVKKIIIAASMSSYGEGMYKCKNCGKVRPPLRDEEQLKMGDWELYCPHCNQKLEPIPTPEETPQICNSVYALSKKFQEELSLILGKTYGISISCLRFFNVYGPRQALSNPYTGVCAIFISRIKNNKPPVVFEDGNQTRDFISVYDVVSACIKCLEKDSQSGWVFNVGSGIPYKIKDIARILIKLLGKDLEPSIPGWYRKGDVRHCYADIEKIKKYLGWEPKVKIEEGLKDLIAWAQEEPAFDNFDLAFEELMRKDLVKGLK